MKTNEVIFKTIAIKTEAHFIEHSEYLKKDSAVIIQNVESENMLEVVNLQRERLKKKAGKVGQPPKIAKGFVFSINPEIQEMVLNMSKEEQEELINGFVEELYKQVKKELKMPDMEFLRKNTQIVLHTDTDNLHFHILMPTFTKSKMPFNNDILPINWGKKTISANARRNMLRKFKKLQNEQIKEMSLEEFNLAARAAKEKNSKPGWKKKKELLKKVPEAFNRLEALKLEYKALLKKFKEEEAPKMQRLMKRMEMQLVNGNTNRAKKTENDLIKEMKKINPKNR